MGIPSASASPVKKDKQKRHSSACQNTTIKDKQKLHSSACQNATIILNFTEAQPFMAGSVHWPQWPVLFKQLLCCVFDNECGLEPVKSRRGQESLSSTLEKTIIRVMQRPLGQFRAYMDE
jgi:hypothetical protein